MKRDGLVSLGLGEVPDQVEDNGENEDSDDNEDGDESEADSESEESENDVARSVVSTQVRALYFFIWRERMWCCCCAAL